jgi:hypothetical protein
MLDNEESLDDDTAQKLEGAIKGLDSLLTNRDFRELIQAVDSTLKELTQIQTEIQTVKASEDVSEPLALPVENASALTQPLESVASSLAPSHKKPTSINKEELLERLERQRQKVVERLTQQRTELHTTHKAPYESALRHLETIAHLSGGIHQFTDQLHASLFRVCLHGLQNGLFHGHPPQTPLMNLNKAGGLAPNNDSYPMIESH